MNGMMRRNRLAPWYVGIVIVLLATGYVGYQMYATGCGAAAPVGYLVLLVIPAVYLALMYLTLTSQE